MWKTAQNPDRFEFLFAISRYGAFSTVVSLNSFAGRESQIQRGIMRVTLGLDAQYNAAVVQVPSM